MWLLRSSGEPYSDEWKVVEDVPFGTVRESTNVVIYSRGKIATEQI